MEVTADKEFQVKSDVESVWALLSDPAKVVVCVPGAQLTEVVDEMNFKGKIIVKIGPVTSKFNGEAKFDKLDADTREMTLSGAGTDTGGKGSATMTMSFVLSELEGGTLIKSSMKLSITGKLAQFGARMIVAVNNKLFGQFTQSFTEMVETGETGAGAEATPVDGLKLAGSALMGMITGKQN